MAEHELLHDQTGLDGLAEADVVGDQQIRPRHGQGPHDGGELVVLDLGPGPERGLEGGLVGGGDRTPADRVKEGVQACRGVDTGGG
ncbi:hypothetical protein OOK13_16075 [Streptomyces sp. NBC_00378]|uniref:hypothetical protein n=1 Tax=unclassified Streptomyces TaxID=2593676 RepID=UPI002258C292|nr:MULTISPECIES: hypothetical protein [unclassified Streptomyces]MCX5110033.1 hypothetical protein [Streptomyces sp. NBC_00378]